MNDKVNQNSGWVNPRHVNNTQSDTIAQSLTRGNALREKMHSSWAMGTFVIELPCSESLNAIALAGFDFVVLDMEHSSTDFSQLQNLTNAAQANGLATLVRIWGEDAGLIGKVLDMGANGIMAPHVSTVERAREIVEQCRFAPLGSRGFSPLTKYDSLQQPLESLNQSTFVVVQIEGREAIDRVADIAVVEGIDAVFVGPYDLALSLGVVPGSRAVFDAAQSMANTIPKQIGLGIYIDDPTTCGAWAKHRFTLQCVSFDGRMLADGARQVVNCARESVAKIKS